MQITDPADVFETPSVGGRPPRRVARQTLAEVIEPRVEEMYGLILAELRRSGFEDLIGSGIVLTGGSSKLQGMVELAEEVFHQPVRLGIPRYTGGLKEVVCTPIYSTGIGLIHFGHRRRTDPNAPEKIRPGLGSIMQKMKSWFKGSF